MGRICVRPIGEVMLTMRFRVCWRLSEPLYVFSAEQRVCFCFWDCARCLSFGRDKISEHVDEIRRDTESQDNTRLPLYECIQRNRLGCVPALGPPWLRSQHAELNIRDSFLYYYTSGGTEPLCRWTSPLRRKIIQQTKNRNPSNGGR